MRGGDGQPPPGSHRAAAAQPPRSRRSAYLRHCSRARAASGCVRHSTRVSQCLKRSMVVKGSVGGPPGGGTGSAAAALGSATRVGTLSKL